MSNCLWLVTWVVRKKHGGVIVKGGGRRQVRQCLDPPLAVFRYHRPYCVIVSVYILVINVNKCKKLV